ncbi:hypothetical protein EW145_g5148 [Phellinidium pouzarii]|uniref:Uncharacterized protein n=1 Tax=Phellinidium pouzarii TaxID=167371 RepID=A0A4S4L5T7_9AGAM|nr:hypothetical protein EW145_g5148 [Phellinidium pouzarii]
MSSTSAAPPPSLSRPHLPSKRRRVTISGGPHPHPLNLSNLPPADLAAHTPPPYTSHGSSSNSGTGANHAHTGPSTPISPVVMGFTIQRDPHAFEQVRAMLAVKQKQKALIEQRRGSVAGLSYVDAHGRRGSAAGLDAAVRRGSVTAPAPSVNIINPTPTSATAPAPPKRTGASPNGARRMGTTPPSLSPNARPIGLGANNNASIAGSTRTRSPSLLGGGRAISPGTLVVAGQTQGQGHGQLARTPPRPYAQPPPPTSSTLPGRSPPSQHPHPHVGSSPNHNHSHSQKNGQKNGQSQSLARPQMPSPPQLSTSSASGGTSGVNGASSNTNANANPNANANLSASTSTTQLVASQGLAALAHNLPPPPTSFAHRRAGQLGMRGNKPADIMISPRESDVGATPSGSANKSQESQQHGAQTPIRLPTISASYKMLQPAIQSAPPRPGHAPGRFPMVGSGTGTRTVTGMALPSLPPVLGQAQGRSAAMRRTPGQVPPTPTRLSMQRAQGAGAESASVRLSQPTGALPRVPRTATASMFAQLGTNGPGSSEAGSAMGGRVAGASAGGVAGGSGLTPATPATVHRATRTVADKAAFLAPFEQFYDTLSDAQVLKSWFSEQLRRVGTLARDAEAQLSRLKEKDRERNETAAAGAGASVTRGEVERMVMEAVRMQASGWQDEVIRLRTRVLELESVLYGHNQREREGHHFSQGQSGRATAESGTRGMGTLRTTNGLPTPVPTASTQSQSQKSTPPPRPSSSNASYPAAPSADAYTFPPIHPPPSHTTFINNTSMHPPPPASTPSTSGMAGPMRLDHLRRSASPPTQHVDLHDGLTGAVFRFGDCAPFIGERDALRAAACTGTDC